MYSGLKTCDNVIDYYYFFNFSLAVKVFSPVWRIFSLVNYSNFFSGKPWKIRYGRLRRLCLVFQTRSP